MHDACTVRSALHRPALRAVLLLATFASPPGPARLAGASGCARGVYACTCGLLLPAMAIFPRAPVAPATKSRRRATAPAPLVASVQV